MTARAVRYQNRLRAEGKCPHCRKPLPINPKTRKPYLYCEIERERRRLHQQERQKRLKRS